MFRRIPGKLATAALAAASILVTVPGAASAQADIARTPSSAPEGRVVAAARPIPGRYIVVLREGAHGAADVHERSVALAGSYGGKVRQTYGSALSGYAADMSESQARRVAADPRVAFVEQDGVEEVTDTQSDPPSWGLDRVDQAKLPLDRSYTYPNGAANVTAYVIDTGIWVSHGQFEGRASVGFDAVGDGNDGIDCNGHGTHVAGILGGRDYGIAKQVKLVAVRVIGCGNTGSTSTTIQGVDWVTAHATKPAVANVSLRGGVSAAKDAAFRRSIAAGITYVAGSGNDSANACDYSPGRIPEVITVQSSDASDRRASTSNYGKCTDLFAPGTNIVSAWKGGDTATRTASGTSMATPHVTGAAAIHLSAHPTATPAEVQAALIDAATPGRITSPGAGSPNRLLRVVG
ncbi:serine protease [Embleya hyalina]|uniref:Serine protease n=2 Tax=Embleya hyalina TaxID=516124 RepID=A0A401YEU1_9ACTN|nr:serine protease [Embleya hyalina]